MKKDVLEAFQQELSESVMNFLHDSPDLGESSDRFTAVAATLAELAGRVVARKGASECELILFENPTITEEAHRIACENVIVEELALVGEILEKSLESEFVLLKGLQEEAINGTMAGH